MQTYSTCPLDFIFVDEDEEDLKPAFCSEVKTVTRMLPKRSDSSHNQPIGWSPQEKPSTSAMHSTGATSKQSKIYRNYISLIEDDEFDEDEDPDFIAAIEASLCEHSSKQDEPVSNSCTSTEVKAIDVVKQFISDNLKTTEDILKVIIHRKSVLSGTIRAIARKSFSFVKPLTVTFSGEDGIDAGGPKREFFRLLMKAITCTDIFDGGWFFHDLDLLKKSKYGLAGKLIAIHLEVDLVLGLCKDRTT